MQARAEGNAEPVVAPAAMRAVEISRFSRTAEGLAMVERPVPSPGPDEVLVEVHAAGLNPSDIGNVAGLFSQTRLPRIPGRDLAGVVVRGPSYLIGQAVWATGAEFGFTRDGAHADYVTAPIRGVRPKPATLSMAQAAAAGVPFVTAWMAIEALGARPGQTLLVIGARGAVGSAACELGRWLGLDVIRAVRSPSGPEDISTEAPDLRDAVLARTSDRGADVCLDTAGGDMLQAGLACLAARGRMAVITARGDGVASFDLRHFYHRELHLLGVDSLSQCAVEAGEILDRIAPGFETSALTSPQDLDVRPLAEAVEIYRNGFDRLLAGQKLRKTVLAPR